MIAGLGGFYLGAAALDAEWFFVMGLGLAAAFSVRRRVLWIPQALLSYRVLVKRVAELEEKVKVAEEQAQRRPAQQYVAFRSGLQEGQAQLRGALLCRLIGDLPELRAVTTGDDGQLILIGKAQPRSKVQLGARLRVVIEETERRKAPCRQQKWTLTDASK